MCGSNSGQSLSERHSITQSDLSSDLVSHDFQVGEPLEDPFLLMGSENEVAQHDAEPLSSSDIRRNSARFLLQLREGKGLSQVAVDAVVEGCEKIVNECLHCVHVDVKSNIHDPEQLITIDNAFQSCTLPFDGLQNEYQQEKFYVQEFNMIVSMERGIYM